MPDHVNVKTAERRTLHFDTLDDIVRDVETVTAGPHHVTGNWTAAQNIWHVAHTVALSNRGFDFKVPLPMKLIGRTLKLLGMHTKPINPGINPPAKVAAAFAPPHDVALEMAIAKLRDEVQYARTHGMNHPSPLFGKLSHDTWIQTHCRHAELHLSFIAPSSAET